MDLIQDILYKQIVSITKNEIQSRYVAYMLSEKENVVNIDEVVKIKDKEKEFLIRTEKGLFHIELCNIDIPNTKITYLID